MEDSIRPTTLNDLILTVLQDSQAEAASWVGPIQALGYMRKFAAAVSLWLLAGDVFAHQDRILPIRADGTLGDLPANYGPVRVDITRAAENPKTLTRVSITSPRFTVSLNQCVLTKLENVAHIEASGSWYHTRGSLPAYVSLTFHEDKYGHRSATSEYYWVTFSLIDGHILMGGRSWDPLFGDWRMQYINPADKCSHWKHLGMRPHNSFTSTPLRRAA